MRPVENIKRFVKNRKPHVVASADIDKRVLDDSFAAMEGAMRMKSVVPQPNIWRTIMKSRITKFAAAAVIIVAVFIGINEFRGTLDGASVVWADIPERLEHIKTVSYRMHVTSKSKEGATEQGESLVYQSSTYGQRADTFEGNKLTVQIYSLPQEKEFIAIMHKTKKYIRKELTENQLHQFPKIGEPRKWLESFLSEEYKELGCDILDGIKVEGIEVEKPTFWQRALADCRVQLWVDIESQLPVRLISEPMFSKEGKYTFTTVLDNFQWDIELDSSVFEPPVIPTDYTEWEVPKQWESRKKAGN